MYRVPQAWNLPCWDYGSTCQVQWDQKLREDLLRVARCTRLQIGRDVPIKLHSQLHSILDKKEKNGRKLRARKFLVLREFSETRQANWIINSEIFILVIIISLVSSRTFRVLKACTICSDNLPIKGMKVSKWGMLLDKSSPGWKTSIPRSIHTFCRKTQTFNSPSWDNWSFGKSLPNSKTWQYVISALISRLVHHDAYKCTGQRKPGNR